MRILLINFIPFLFSSFQKFSENMTKICYLFSVTFNQHETRNTVRLYFTDDQIIWHCHQMQFIWFDVWYINLIPYSGTFLLIFCDILTLFCQLRNTPLRNTFWSAFGRVDICVTAQCIYICIVMLCYHDYIIEELYHNPPGCFLCRIAVTSDIYYFGFDYILSIAWMSIVIIITVWQTKMSYVSLAWEHVYLFISKFEMC